MPGSSNKSVKPVSANNFYVSHLAALLKKKRRTLGISGAHRRQRMRGLLRARPLHAVVGLRSHTQFVITIAAAT